MNDEYYMQQAINMAKLAEKNNEVPVGAVCVYKDEIIATGKNQLINDHNTTAHAELMALVAAAQQQQNYRLLDVTLYVTLEPCTMCVGAMIHARIKRVVFGSYDYKTGACGSKHNLLKEGLHNHNIEVTGGVLQQQCSKMLSDFFKRRRKEKKAPIASTPC